MCEAEIILKNYCKENKLNILDLFTKKELVSSISESFFFLAMEEEYLENPNLLPYEAAKNVEDWIFYKKKQELWEECLSIATRKVLLKDKAEELGYLNNI